MDNFVIQIDFNNNNFEIYEFYEDLYLLKERIKKKIQIKDEIFVFW